MVEPSPRLSAFLEVAPEGSLRVLAALSAAESLSDWLAYKLVTIAAGDRIQPKAFVSALHLTGFIVERNSEWHLSSTERAYLGTYLLKEHHLFADCHGYLASLAFAMPPQDADTEVPNYLKGPVGRAFHLTATSPSEGLPLYQAAYGGSLGERWLAARLANEQLDQKLIPQSAIEPAFLQGMVLYREGRFEQAMQALRPVAYSQEDRHEVAISAHLFGRSLRRRNPREADRLLHRSLYILETLDDRFGQAHVLHTLGQIVWQRDPKKAERYLRKSLKIGEEIHHDHHRAEVLHTLGQNLWTRNATEAEALLRLSLELLTGMGDRDGQAQVQHTLGQKLWQRDPTEAEQLLRQSLEIRRATKDKYSQAQVLHTLGQKLIGTHSREAQALLQESLVLGEEINNLRHQAIVLLTLGKLTWPVDPKLGRELILRSLQLNRRAGDRSGENIVLREMRLLRIDPAAG